MWSPPLAGAASAAAAAARSHIETATADGSRSGAAILQHMRRRRVAAATAATWQLHTAGTALAFEATVASIASPASKGFTSRGSISRWFAEALHSSRGQHGSTVRPACLPISALPAASLPLPAAVAVEDAWALLQEFSAKEARGLAQTFLDSRDKRQRLRDALLVRQPSAPCCPPAATFAAPGRPPLACWYAAAAAAAPICSLLACARRWRLLRRTCRRGGNPRQRTLWCCWG